MRGGEAGAMVARSLMALTAELVAKVAREVPDPGPEPHFEYFTDADYVSEVRRLLDEEGATGDVWVFACGSLIWKPACPVAGHQVAVLHGWHRSFCLQITRWRGTPECPGLMMGMDRGGRCRGVAYRLPAAEVTASLDLLLRRETSVKPPANIARWVTVTTADGPLRALAFTIDRHHQAYAGRLPLEHVAEKVAVAAGHRGSCAEYLFYTVEHLERFGIRDRNLWRLQAMVAERIRRLGQVPGTNEAEDATSLAPAIDHDPIDAAADG